jgi:phospholipid/cholesterol/gamma-HCH transport system ATP-binding protein
MIVLAEVYKSFGKQQVLDGVSIEIASGKTTTIVGPSGAGKSVLMKLIMGLFKPDSGSIKVLGHDINGCSSEKDFINIRSKLGVLFQSAALFDSLNIFDNVAFALKERLRLPRRKILEEVAPIFEALSLEPFANKLPQEVTIGVRKRVGLARALVTKPEIILFDEPNTGLDPLVGQEVYDLIKSMRACWGFTGIVISHELPEVFQISDRVAMLLNGRIIIEGTPEDIINSDNLAVQQFLNGKTDGPIKIQ